MADKVDGQEFLTVVINGRIYQATSVFGTDIRTGEDGWKIARMVECMGDGIAYLNLRPDNRTNGKTIYDSAAQALATAVQVIGEREFTREPERGK